MQIVETASSTIEIHDTRVRKIARILPRADQLAMEASCLKTLEGHGVAPKLFKLGNLGDLPFLDMERIQGQTLSKTNFSTTDQQVHFCWALLDCLCTIHENNILHRDLKPSNIMVNHGEPRIIDFGCACQENESNESSRKIIYSTPKIVPPEIHHRENDWNKSSDVFSLGVCFYYVCCGRYPFEDEDLASLTESICYDQATPLEHPLWPIINNCLQKNPNDRYQDCNPILGDMIRVLKDESVEDRSPSVATETKRFLGHSVRPFLILGTIVALTGFLSLLIFQKYCYDDGLIAIKFDHISKVTRGTMVNSQFRYQFDGDETIRVEPGSYFVTFYKEDGSIHETVKNIRKNMPTQVAYTYTDHFEKKPEESFRRMRGVLDYEYNSENFYKTYTRNINGSLRLITRDYYSYSETVLLMEHSTFRLPTLFELTLLGKNRTDYLYLEDTAFNRAGRIIPISRSIPASKTLSFFELKGDH